MGVVSFSIPQKLVNAFITNLKIPNFVETGTYKGNSAIWSAAYFDKVFTIEISPELHKYASERPDAKPNIEFVLGSSETELPGLVNKLNGPTLFWLDGHWCMNAGGEDDECPLIAELTAISKLQDSIILIDDARCFLGPLPKPHRAEDWPRIDEIFSLIKEKFPNHTTTIIDDVIVSVPSEAKEVLDNCWQQTFNERFYDPAYTLKKYSIYQIAKSTLKNLIKK